MRTSNPLRTARTLSGLSRSQLAALAGVAPSTVIRIENGESDVTMRMAKRILAAAGFAFEGTLVPVSDPVAVAAARSVIDPTCGLGSVAGVERWLDGWKAIGLVQRDGESGRWNTSDPAGLASRAGLSARLAYRPGLRAYRRKGSWEAIAEGIAATGQPWAATGSTAANRLVRSADAPWPVFYVSDPDLVGTLAGFSARGRGERAIGLLPLDRIADVGVEVDERGYRWADPVQVWIDCYGGTDRMPEQADTMADLFTRTTATNA